MTGTDTSSSLLRRLLAALSVACLLAAAAMPAGAQQTEAAPDQLLEATLHEMLEALRAERATLEDDPKHIYTLVEDILVPRIDFGRASRWVLGRHWRTASDEQKRAFVREFRTLLVRFYSNALVEYVNTNEIPDADIMTFKPLRVPADEKDVTVRSEVRQPNGSTIPVDYQMYRTKRGWRVYDVSVEGISMVVSYRSTFATEISQGGMDGLIASLRERNAKLAAEEG